MKEYYIFTDNEPIKIEIHPNNILKVDGKWISVDKYIEQMLKFIERIKK